MLKYQAECREIHENRCPPLARREEADSVVFKTVAPKMAQVKARIGL